LSEVAEKLRQPSRAITPPSLRIARRFGQLRKGSTALEPSIAPRRATYGSQRGE